VPLYHLVGLFNVEDRHVACLVDTALRHVWRKEECHFLIGSIMEKDNRFIAETGRAMRRQEGRGGPAERAPSEAMVKMSSLHPRFSFSSARPRVRVPTTAALSAVQAVIKVMEDTSYPSNLLRSVGQNPFVVYQSLVVAEAGRTVETLAGVVAAALLLGCGSTPSAVAAASPVAPGGSSAGGATKVGGSHMMAASTDAAPVAAETALFDAEDVEGGTYESRSALAHVAAPPADQGG